VLPAVSRPPIPGVPGVRPIMPPVIRPAVVPTVTPAEKPQTTVYIGKIASSVDNDYMLSLLQVGFFFLSVFLLYAFCNSGFFYVVYILLRYL
jgi:hypothetical protein